MFVLVRAACVCVTSQTSSAGPFIELSEDERVFTYTRTRIIQASARQELLSTLLIEPTLVPRPAYHLVIESSNGSAGYCGISGIQEMHQAEFGWYLPL